MMLTKKGSTRGTVSVLFLSALIFLVARFAVNAIETAMPDTSRKAIAWKPIPDVLKNDRNSLWVDTRDDKPDADTNVKSSETESGPTRKPAEQSEFSKAKFNEEIETLNSVKENSNHENSFSAVKPAKAPKKPKKRFALEKLFADNVEQLPVLIFFSDDGSPISKKMENTSLGITEIRKKIEKEYYPVKIRFDKKLSKTEYRLYQEYGTTAVPVVHILTSTGEQLAYNSGYISAVKVMVMLHNAKRKQLKLEEKSD